MRVYEVRFLEESLADLEEIILYIAQDSKTAAINMHDKIIERIGGLETFPKRGRLIDDEKLAAAGYRMLIIKPYIAFYRIIDDKVVIYRILHGAINYPLLLGRITSKDDCVE